jgi:hypothetical protein
MNIIKLIKNKKKVWTSFKGNKTLKNNVYLLDDDDLKAIEKQLALCNVVGRSEQLICDTCKSGLIDYPEINRRTCRCGALGYNVTD